MKKFFVTVIGLLIFFMTPAFAHKWEWASFDSSAANSVYIDTDSVINVQELFALSDPCFQALFKVSDTTVLINFRRHGVNFYFSAMPVSANALNLLDMPSIKEQEQTRYLELRNRGASPGMSSRILNRERASIKEDLSRRYSEAIMTYGRSSDGSLNLLGVSLLYKMATVNVQNAALLAQSFAFAPYYDVIEQGSVLSKLRDAAIAKLVFSSR